MEQFSLGMLMDYLESVDLLSNAMMFWFAIGKKIKKAIITKIQLYLQNTL